MFCTNCGNKIEESDKFCTECGNLSKKDEELITVKATQTKMTTAILSEEKWWQRLLRVGYIFLCLQILWIVPAVWNLNTYSYNGHYYGQDNFEATPDKAFWYSILAILIFMVTTRLLKITVLYIAVGKKPNWASEFKKLY